MRDIVYLSRSDFEAGLPEAEIIDNLKKSWGAESIIDDMVPAITYIRTALVRGEDQATIECRFPTMLFNQLSKGFVQAIIGHHGGAYYPPTRSCSKIRELRDLALLGEVDKLIELVSSSVKDRSVFIDDAIYIINELEKDKKLDPRIQIFLNTFQQSNQLCQELDEKYPAKFLSEVANKGNADQLIGCAVQVLNKQLLFYDEIVKIILNSEQDTNNSPKVVAFTDLFHAAPIRVKDKSTGEHCLSFEQFISEEPHCLESKDALLSCANNFCNLYPLECQGTVVESLMEPYVGMCPQ